MGKAVLQPACRLYCAGDVIEQHSFAHGKVVQSSSGKYPSTELTLASFSFPIVQFFDSLRHWPGCPNRQFGLNWPCEVAMPSFRSAPPSLRPPILFLHHPRHHPFQLRSVHPLILHRNWDLEEGLGQRSGRRQGLGTQGGAIGEQDGAIESGQRAWCFPLEFEGSLHANQPNINYRQQRDESEQARRQVAVNNNSLMNKSEKQSSQQGSQFTPNFPLTTRRAKKKVELSDESSSYLSSNYRRYLTHLTAGQPPQEEDDYHVFWNAVTKCILYLKREYLNDQYHDQILFALLKPHFDFTRLDPTPTSEVGEQLLRCGYFLAAYAVLLVRLRRKGTQLLEYFRVVYSKFRIKFGEAEMQQYLKEDHPCLGHLPAYTPSIRTDDPIVRSFLGSR